jgi:NAD(P)-dependent dehydrogenase (short-subunit alcohol dehydrogenase family)
MAVGGGAMEVKGRPVWITGAGSGIGLEFTREFWRRGASVVAIDRSAAGLAELEKEAALLRFPLKTLVADVTAGRDFIAALEALVPQCGAPAVFVNNAGIARAGGFLEVGLETFELVMRVNAMGVVYGTHFALPHMQKAGRGLIINIASTAGLVPSSFMPSYTASKHAVVGFTRSLQLEMREAGSPVRFCLVTPGFIDTPILNQPGVDIPGWLRWTVSKPAVAVSRIVKGALAGEPQVTPDFTGRLLQRVYKWAPALAGAGSIKLRRSK